MFFYQHIFLKLQTILLEQNYQIDPNCLSKLNLNILRRLWGCDNISYITLKKTFIFVKSYYYLSCFSCLNSSFFFFFV